MVAMGIIAMLFAYVFPAVRAGDTAKVTKKAKRKTNKDRRGRVLKLDPPLFSLFVTAKSVSATP